MDHWEWLRKRLMFRDPPPTPPPAWGLEIRFVSNTKTPYVARKGVDGKDLFICGSSLVAACVASTQWMNAQTEEGDENSREWRKWADELLRLRSTNG